jgi:RNA polymerase sigma-70 factor (ECF subfamily)
MPDEPEVHGLLAMMLLLGARAPARTRDGELVLLHEQDSALWDRDEIARGRAVLDRALALHGRGPYVLQAAIASLHADEPRPWREILALYDQLVIVADSPVVRLSAAVVRAEVDGPEAALAVVDGLELDGYRYFHATRGELLTRLGRDADAADAFARALELAVDPAERRFLSGRVEAATGRATASP